MWSGEGSWGENPADHSEFLMVSTHPAREMHSHGVNRGSLTGSAPSQPQPRRLSTAAVSALWVDAFRTAACGHPIRLRHGSRWPWGGRNRVHGLPWSQPRARAALARRHLDRDPRGNPIPVPDRTGRGHDPSVRRGDRGIELTDIEQFPERVTIDVLGPCIEYFNNIITPEEAQFIIDSAEYYNNEKTHPWKYENATVGNLKIVDKFVRSNKTLSLVGVDNSDSNDALSIVSNAVAAAVRYYSVKHDFQIEADEGFILLKYQKGNEYKPHYDAGIGKPYSDRTLSMVMYLNPTEYSGGETNFVNFDVSVKPNNPGLVLFPSNYAYTHQAMPVTGGTKYAIVTWLRMPLEFK